MAERCLAGQRLSAGDESRHVQAVHVIPDPGGFQDHQCQERRQHGGRAKDRLAARPQQIDEQHRQKEQDVQIGEHAEPRAEREGDAPLPAASLLPRHGGPHGGRREENGEGVVARLLPVPDEERGEGGTPRRGDGGTPAEDARGEPGEGDHRERAGDHRRHAHHELGVAEPVAEKMQNHLEQGAVVGGEDVPRAQHPAHLGVVPGEDLVHPETLLVEPEPARQKPDHNGEPHARLQEKRARLALLGRRRGGV